jgi:hypothetical protein
MASGWTNKGRRLVLAHCFQGVALPTNWYVALVTAAVVPNADTNTLSELTQIANGNGYTTNGVALAKNSTDFDVLTEDDTSDLAKVQIKDLVWTAAGGALPASGNGAAYAVLTDDNATAGSRNVYFFWDLSGPLSVSSGQPITLQDCEMRIA